MSLARVSLNPDLSADLRTIEHVRVSAADDRRPTTRATFEYARGFDAVRDPSARRRVEVARRGRPRDAVQ